MSPSKFLTSAFKHAFSPLCGSAFGLGTSKSELGTPMSGLKASVSGCGTPMSGVKASVSGFGTRMSGVKASVSGFGTPMSEVKASVSGFGTPMSGLKASVSGFGTRMSGVKASNSELGSSKLELLGGKVANLVEGFMGGRAVLRGCPSFLTAAVVLTAFLATATVARDVTGMTGSITATNGEVLSGKADGLLVTINSGTTVTFQNLTIIGDVAVPVTIGTGSVGAKIILEGTNLLSGGIGSAALRVPTDARLTIEGPGILNATGGQWRALITTAAGAGIGGGVTTNTGGGGTALQTADPCGMVIINGGTINAYGGGSGQGTQNMYGAGIGGSGNARGCDLTVNGGNVTAVGGYGSGTTANDIGPGVGGNNGTTYGTGGATVINGGSVKGNIRVPTGNMRTLTTAAITVTATQETCPTNTADCNTVTSTTGAAITGNGQEGTRCYRCYPSATGNCGAPVYTNTVNSRAASVTLTAFNNSQCRYVTTTVTETAVIQWVSASSTTTGSSSSSATSTVVLAAGGGTNGANSTTGTGGLGECNTTVCREIPNQNSTAQTAVLSDFKDGVMCVKCTRGSSNCGNVQLTYNGVAATTTGANGNLNNNNCRFFTLTTSSTSMTRAYDSWTATATNALANSQRTPVSKHTFTVGESTNPESRDVLVNGCHFGNGTANYTIDCREGVPPTANTAYGIKDVKTDFNRQVTFYLPTFTPLNTNSMVVNNKTYNPISITDRTNMTFKGPVPNMTVEIPAANSFVCEPGWSGNGEGNCNATGPYKTGFRMSGNNHVAAIGKTITMFKGTYVRNDADVEASGTRTHAVRWCRSDNPDQANCRLIATDNLHTGRQSITYTPGAGDYGMYIWAEVTVRDNSGKESAAYAVKYPAIRVGVIVTAERSAGIGFRPGQGRFETEQEFLDNSSATFLQVGRSPEAGLVWEFGYPLNPLWFTLSAIASVTDKDKGAIDAGYLWTAKIGATDVGSFGVTGNSINPASFTLPTPGECGNTLQTCIGSSVITGDITLSVVIRDGTVPQLKEIKVFASGADVLTDAALATGTVSDQGNVLMTYANGTGTIPKEGKILLTFNKDVGLQNITGAYTDGNDIPHPQGTARFEYSGQPAGTFSAGAAVGAGSSDQIEYTYSGLTAGNTYLLAVKDYVNFIGNPMANIQYNLTVEKKAFVTWTGDNIGENEIPSPYNSNSIKFIVNDNVTGTFAYATAGHQGGNRTGTECYWEIQSGVGNTEPQGFDAFNSSKLGATNVCTGVGDLRTTASYNLVPGDYGKWIRLVVRPISANSVDGTNEGEISYGKWMRIGVLLVPALATGADAPACTDDDCRIYRNVTLRGCDAFDNYDDATTGCTRDGLIVYDYANVRLGVAIYDITPLGGGETEYYQSSGWKDDIQEAGFGMDTECGIGFSCGTISNYQVTEGHIPSSGKIVITPIYAKVNPPTVTFAYVNQISNTPPYTETPVDLATGDKDDISITGNAVEIHFSLPITNTNEGRVRITGQGYANNQDINVAANVTWTGTQQLKIPLTLVPNQSYKIIVSDFKSPDQMQTVQFNFMTADAPSATVPVLAQAGHTVAEGFVVGTTQITYTGGEILPNAGGASATISNCWQRVTATAGVTLNAACTQTTATYTPNTAGDFGSYIRLVIIPSGGGTRVASDWVHVGAILKLSGFTNNGATNPVVSINGTTVTDGGAGVLVFGNAAVQVATDVGTDKLDGAGWSVTGGGSVDNATAMITTWKSTPTPPTGDVTLSATVKDGSKPTVTATYNKTTYEFTLTIDKPVTSVNTKTLKIKSGNTVEATYTLTGSSVSSGTTLSFTFPDFTPSSDAQYSLEIDEGAFVDTRGNGNDAGILLTFSGGGTYYAISPSIRTRTINKLADNTTTLTYGDAVDAQTFTVTNVSTDGISNVTVDVDNKDLFSASCANCTGNIPVNDSRTITVSRTANKLPAGTHEIKVTIKNTENKLSEEVTLTYVVAQKVIAIGNPAEFSGAGSRVYDRTTNSPAISYTWDGTDKVSSDNVNITTTSEGFDNPNVGTKSVNVTYEITGADADNYKFSNGVSKQTEPLTLTITKRPVNLVIINKDFGTKQYDGLNFLANSSAIDGNYGIEALGTNSGILTAEAGDVKFEKDYVEFTWQDEGTTTSTANKGMKDITGIKNASLSGTATALNNYDLILPTDYTNAKVEVIAASLAYLRVGTTSTFNGYEATETTKCVVKAEAVYGDELARNQSWKEPPTGYLGTTATDCQVAKEGLIIAGTWEIQSSSSSIVECPEAGCPGTRTINNAYFKPRSANYESDLVIPVSVNVDKKTISIAADLSGANDGSKTYDGNNTLTGVKASTSGTAVVPGDQLGDVTAVATFNDANVGSNKPLTVAWTLDIDNAKKYSAGNTSMLGSIVARKVSVTGFTVADKVYDGTQNIGSTTGSPVLTYAGGKDSEGKDVPADEGVIAGDFGYDGDVINHSKDCVQPSGSATGGRFQNANVDWDGEKALPVPVIYAANSFSLVAGPGTGNDCSGNYEVKSVETAAKILQADFGTLPGTPNSALVLKASGEYKDVVGNINIKSDATCAVGATNCPANTFPKYLNGVNSTTIPGYWSWVDFTEQIAGDATAATVDGNRVCLDVNFAATSHKVRFEGQNNNYKNYETTVSLCVMPLRLQVNPPSGFAAKVYDGTTDADIPALFNGIPANDACHRNDGTCDGITVGIVKATYDEPFASEEGRKIKLQFKVNGDANVLKNFLPPADYEQELMSILPRPVTFAGISVKDKYYDGTADANANVSVAYPLAPSAISGNLKSGVVCYNSEKTNCDKVSFKDTVLDFEFTSMGDITSSAGDNISIRINPTIANAITLTGDDRANYKFELPSLSANIYKASLANKNCSELIKVYGNGKYNGCPDIPKKELDSWLEKDLALGRDSKVLNALITSKANGIKSIKSYYDYTYNSFAENISEVVQDRLDRLFCEENMGCSTMIGTWYWNDTTAYKADGVTPRRAEVGSWIGSARLVHSNSNYEIIEHMPIPVDIGQFLLQFTATGGTQIYEPDRTNIALTVIPLNGDTAGCIKITGRGTMATPDVGNNKDVEVIRSSLQLVTDDSKEGCSADEIKKNYAFPENIADGLVGETMVNIIKADYKGYPTAVATPNKVVYDTLALSARDIALTRGWEWTTASGSTRPAVGCADVDVIFTPPDPVNYNTVPGKVNLCIDPRSKTNTLASGYGIDGKGVAYDLLNSPCGADSVTLNVKTSDPFASVLYNDGAGLKRQLIDHSKDSTHVIKVTGLDFGWNSINFQVEAQDYNTPKRNFSHSHYRDLPFGMVIKWVNDKSLTVSLDSLNYGENGKAFLNKNKFVTAKTEWYEDGKLLGVARSLSITKQAGHNNDSAINRYSARLVTESGEQYTTCMANGFRNEYVPIHGGSNVKFAVSPYGVRMVAGGTSLVLDTPNGGVVSIYTAKGELISKMNAVDNRTLVKVPKAHGMYIVKIEVK